MPRIRLDTFIQAPPQRVFDLSVDVDVHMASSSPSNERAVAGVTTGRMRLDDEVEWRATHFGIPWRMRSRITAVDEPHCFIDEMQRGPFRRWHHTHRFIPLDGGTRMVDEVRYEAPLGLLGRIVERAVLHEYMTRLLAARNAHIKQVAEGEP
ncbi:MAG TPA: SRPBCC family protein [Acidimicrobiales bacterium]|jgi:ligand-binding SRPBCC domain-containing protein